MEEIIATLIGGALAAGTGWLLERQRQKAQLKQARRLLTRAICDDLSYSIQTYDKIAEEWEKMKTVWFATINELRESRQPYTNSKDWIVILDNDELCRKIFRYYSQSANRMNTLEQYQKRKYELEKLYGEVVRNIQLKEENLSLEEAKKLAFTYIDSESKEHDRICVEMPAQVNRLVGLKSTAEDLINSLKKLHDPR